MGVKIGDIVTIYMPRIPEQVIAMLACAKIGVPHSVVYGGFSVEALAERIEDAQSRVLITTDGGWLRGKFVTFKDIADEAMARQPTIEACTVVKRTGQDIYMEAGRDYWSQLYRLYTADERSNQFYLRRRSKPPLSKPLVADDRTLWNYYSIYRTDSNPRLDTLWRQLDQQA